jgi:hypothetical protein
MIRQKLSREVLLDNYTLQGTYSYLECDKRGKLYEECLSNLVESVVLYDRIYVPNDVLVRNHACKKIADQFKDIIFWKL